MISFTLPIEGFSVNASYTRDARFKTSAFKKWELDVHRLLNKVDFSDLDKRAPSYEVHLNFVYPKDVFFNSSGKISARTKDISNTEKSCLDMIFVKWLGIDDRFVTKMISKKTPGEAHSIEVEIHETV